MPATPWTELTAPADAWQKGFSSGGAIGTVDFLFGSFPLTQDEFISDQATSYSEITANAPVGTELTAPSTPYTELTV